MRARHSSSKKALVAGLLGIALGACGSSGGGNTGTGGSAPPAGSGGSAGRSGSGGNGSGGSGSGGNVGSGGNTGSGGAVGTGGSSSPETGGSPGSGGTVGQGGSTSSGQGGATSAGGRQSGGTTGSGGQTGPGTGGAAGTTGGGTQPDGGLTSSCVPTKTWGTLDPSSPGPFEVQVEKDVGPENGVPDAKWNNQKPHFNLYRPKDLSQGYCHPIVSWGNGTGDQPPTYEVLIKQLASHGFVVVASLSSQTLQGDPLPQVAGVNWMIAESENPSSPLYHHLDVTHVGATGHSQGGAATTASGADPRINATSAICGSKENVTLHGPALLICGGADTMVPCSRVQPAFDSIKTVPVMMAELAGVTHGSWIGSIKDPVMVGTTGWMRVHLMNDTANRSMFYGASCKVCSDSNWKVQRKMMDQ